MGLDDAVKLISLYFVQFLWISMICLLSTQSINLLMAEIFFSSLFGA